MRFRYRNQGREYDVALERQGAGYRLTVGGETYDLEVLDEQPGELSLRFAGRPVKLFWASDGGRKWVSLTGCTYLLEKPQAGAAGRPGDAAGEGAVRAPMPAQVRAVEVGLGEVVTRGQTLLLLEAMKMEIRIQAPRPGRVTAIHVQKGQTIDHDALLVEIGEGQAA